MIHDFDNNKYTRMYFSIIDKAKHETRSKKVSYFESHHIVPKFNGGTNDPDNLILLTAREHFIAHWLLTKMNSSNEYRIKAYYAFSNMSRSNNHQRNYSARQYTISKSHNSKAAKLRKDNPWKKTGPDHFAYGKKHSDETKKKQSLSGGHSKGKKWFNNGTRNTLAFECPPNFVPGYIHDKSKPNGFKGKTHSKEAREKISKTHKGKVPWNKGIQTSRSPS